MLTVEYLYLFIADGCSLHVNSGGNDLTITESNRKVLYEGDAGVDGGSSRFFRSDNNWGLVALGTSWTMIITKILVSSPCHHQTSLNCILQLGFLLFHSPIFVIAWRMDPTL